MKEEIQSLLSFEFFTTDSAPSTQETQERRQHAHKPLSLDLARVYATISDSGAVDSDALLDALMMVSNPSYGKAPLKSRL